jgi:hypothetical protein
LSVGFDILFYMTEFSRQCLDDPEASAFAEQIFSELQDHEQRLDEDKSEPDTIPSQVRLEYRDAFPEYLVVRSDSLNTFLSKAALAGAGYINAEEVPQELNEQVQINMDAFRNEIRDLYDRIPPGTNNLTGFTYRFFALEKDAVKEMLAHHFLVVGRTSKYELGLQ